MHALKTRATVTAGRDKLAGKAGWAAWQGMWAGWPGMGGWCWFAGRLGEVGWRAGLLKVLDLKVSERLAGGTLARAYIACTASEDAF